ncbi:uncharacterized protein DUF1524 [Methylobacter tundripaludum]|uniref:Uncharacterized protein DUF1524 n=1 Tax=Methylobacter tundripaludum TaxID=173365 RepID=A0A2S6HEQ1_9GAMM|nr:uncharacterized protein DUF1524 [Methylobacter tundripaludum]
MVDGQQRLTTIYILLTYLKDMVAILGKTRFKISFETRGEANEPFLEAIDLSRAEENVDFFHICQAYQAIENWFADRDPMHKLKLLQHFLNDDETGRNVKVIWFKLAENDNPVDAFTRLNVGKIPLTNDELIRALFLRRSGSDESEAQNLQIRIAYEWDHLEKSLQSDAFWYFLNNQPGTAQNRIGFLFDLVVRADGLPKEAEHDAYGIFYSFSQKLKTLEASTEHEWRKIKQAFLMLEEWFEDRVLFHMVGYLINEGMDIIAIRKLSVNCTKSSFEDKLRREIFTRAIGKVLKTMDKQSVQEDVEERLESLNYGSHSAKIKSILLLFNLATLLQNRCSNLRFQFDSFKSESWDIEHVRSVTSDKPERHPERVNWLKHCLGYLELQGTEESLRDEINAFLVLTQVEATHEVFDPLYDKVLAYFRESVDKESDHSIANLALLDEHTNRSYKNSVFAVKRQRLLNLDQAGTFIPLCTRNVFLKCYSPLVDNVMFWSAADRDGYQEAITQTLVNFFVGSMEGIE